MIRRETDCEFYLDKLRRGEAFSFSRWGDGEWNSVLGLRRESEANCDGHHYFRRMGDQLARALMDHPMYFVAMQPLAMRLRGGRIERWLSQKSVNLAWHEADVFHNKSERGEIGDVLEALRNAGDLIVVGPPHLRQLSRYVEYRGFIEAPRKDCFLALDEIQTRIALAVSRVRKPAVVSISAGMPANLIVHNLYQKIGNKAFLIDFGSLWDPYCGVSSRRYHRKLRLG